VIRAYDQAGNVIETHDHKVGLSPSRIFLRLSRNQRNTGDMKTRLPNITPFAPFDRLPPLNKVDQTMMRRLRELADRRGRSVERLIHEALEQWVAKGEAERDLETKIVRFPKR
jgi:hypothetical protein